ncbi:MAG: bifunctional diaminohydroxyphosphoribosylaminopyrimidine deaminase/5-amino-6-(5-phosphoribosylamino)uracil reductase RibD [Lentisphaeria bacterium]|nr:bifunctional diaminohydroxyphosphoribosylaminopyrimidine deaminase/5-amino-6-(5-phosphoribosylamino)uracil reductase RibD [Lentisphaeria bacterium]
MGRVATEDRQWMRRALGLARRAWGRTSPNPMVGAVVVRDGVCVGEGYHPAAGQPHAEALALDEAGGLAAGATLYVTLEPCCTHGRMPPCTDVILRAGVARVVAAVTDPNPVHCGRGVAVLRQQGVTVDVGVLEEPCRVLNESFFWWIRRRRPFVLLKLGTTLDGRIATADGQSRWITGASSRRQVQRLRQWADAIMVGGETARLDNPSLTVRVPARWPRQPRRFVWTSRALDPSSALMRDGTAPAETAKPESTVEWLDFLGGLGQQDVTALLLEGGGELAASALRAGIVNKVAFFVAPRILGGRGSRPAVGGRDPLSLDEAVVLDGLRVRHVGEDVLLVGYPVDVHGSD